MIGYLLAFLYLFVRGFARFTQVELWAEDGAVMLRDALTQGWPSVFHPTDATPQVYQRFVGMLAYSVFPIEYYPHVMAYAALAVNALVLGHFARPQYRWLVTSDRVRVLTVIALCSIPGLTEMLGNVANTNWFLFFGCCLIILKDPERGFSVGEMVFFVISFVSIGTGILLVPLLFFRMWLKRKTSLKLEFVTLGLLFAHILLVRSFKSSAFFEIPQEPVSFWLKTYWRVLVESFFLQPWLGDRLTIYLFASEHRVLHSIVSSILVSIFVSIAWTNRREPLVQALLILFFLISLWPVLCWIGRPGSIITFAKDSPSHWYFSHRYSFPTAFVAVIVWTAILPRKRGVQMLFCLLVVFHSYGRWRIPAYGSENRWKTAGPLLDNSIKNGDPKKVRIPVYPERLDFDFER